MTHTPGFSLRLDESLAWIKKMPRCTHLEVPEELAVRWLNEPALGLSVFLAGWLEGKCLVAENTVNAHRKKSPYAFEYLPVEVGEKYQWWRIRLARSLLERKATGPGTALWDFGSSSPDLYLVRKEIIAHAEASGE